MLIFDIETGPVADEQLAEQFKFVPLPHPGEFDPSSVKVGNLKDQAKITAKIEEARQADVSAVENYEQNLTAARDAAWNEFKGNAALSATTGQVLAIGIQRGDKAAIFQGDEPTILIGFWKKYLACRPQIKLVGCNIFDFDLPFLIRRSWMLGVDVPRSVCEFGKWSNFDPLFVDIRQRWLLGQRNNCPSSLDTMARALGCGHKTDGVNGADFSRLWNGTPEERQLATDYLLNDLQMTANVAKRLGVM